MSSSFSPAAPLLALPRPAKRMVVVAVDLLLSVVSVWIAFYLRIDQTGLPFDQQYYVYLLAPALMLPIFIRFGLYRAIFRYTGMAAMASTAKAIALYAALFFAALLYFRWGSVPRTLGLIQPLLLLLLVGASRAMARFWLAGLGGRRRPSEGRMLIYGAGEAGVQTALALGVSRQFAVLGFIDDDAAKAGQTINGVDIMAPDDVAGAVTRMGVTDILLAMPSLARARRNEIIASLSALPVHVRTLPGLGDLAAGRIEVKELQELDVEDLLGRAPVPPDPALLARNLTAKTVLVTGAGGSIGGELCRQIVREGPRALVLVDHNEYGLYAIHRELQALCADVAPSVKLVPLLGSVRNRDRMREIFRCSRPDTVYHAAAYKHVPLVEDNPTEGVLNNVIGTLNLARVAIECGVGDFVLISTDKAVRPTNVMGATKRVAEQVLQALAASPRVGFAGFDGEGGSELANRTRFSMVRFGNVLGSSGSVVPLFRRQIQAGGPLTVTHEEVTRYFMTIPEAAQLVLQAGAMAGGGDVFVLDMGQPVKIVDLARRMVHLSGLSLRDAAHPEGDIEIRIVGLRPGEKLYEELLIGDNPAPTAHPRIMKAQERFVPWPDLVPQLHEMRLAANRSDPQAIRRILMRLVDGYTPEARRAAEPGTESADQEAMLEAKTK
ncbi:MAG: Nucleoside-diphosphate sugar epimerase/dehydratase [Burkholderiaceae bacterium]|jgi:FlaA1/EpsC-like NDP-sugar epimerase|nr:MAG: Nucleoside-diphosphate sugar epimerase/dehydratase [Burkholderiaceae bacterium]